MTNLTTTITSIFFLPVPVKLLILLICFLNCVSSGAEAFIKESPTAVAFRPQRLSSTSSSPFTLCKLVAEPSSSETQSSPHRNRNRLVIVGGGIGGLSSAYDARHILKGDTKTQVTVVSDQAYFSFTPSNPWIATRKRTPRDIQLPLDKILPRHGVDFIQDAAIKLEPLRNRLQLQSGKWLEYDYLIIATGPRLAFDRIPGLASTVKEQQQQHQQHSAAASICTTPHALHAADLVDALQHDPGPIIVGATQGASCFGPAYEFILLLHHELSKRGGKALVDACRPMAFVTPEPFVGHLGLNGAGDSQKVMQGLFNKYNIDLLTTTRTIKATPTSLTVEQMDEETGKVLQRKVLPSKLTMMIPPFEGQDVWKRVPQLTDKHGLVTVNEHQQSPVYSNIFAVGVAVSIPNQVPTLLKCGVPKTGYLIESQGTAAIRNIQTLIQATNDARFSRAAYMKDDDSRRDDDDDNIHSLLAGVKLHSRPLLNALCITDFGNDGAVFVTMPQMPPRRMDVTIHGKIATLAKIAFEKYFLHKIETGDTDPYYEKYMLKLVGVERTIEE